AANALAAQQTVSFAGKVFDTSEQAVAGATVYVAVNGEARPGEPSPKPTIRQAKSGPDGSFRLTVPVSGENWWGRVAAIKDGHGPGGQYLASVEPTTGLAITLTRPSFAAGQVIDREGRPVAGAKVAVTYASLASYETVVLPPPEAVPGVTTDAKGRFRI